VSFIWPAMLLLLLLVPAGAWLYARLDRRRRRHLAAYGSLALPPSGGRSLGRRRLLSPAFLVIGLSVMVVALARPQAVVSLPRVEGTVILAFDVSGSMAADDLKPTRMEAAKAAARELVARQPPSVLIGVVAFSESGFSVQAPTNDQETVLSAINRLAPTRGTSLARGILTSLDTIAAAEADPAEGYYTERPTGPDPTPVPAGTHSSAVIVLLSDGENTTSPDPMAAATAAAQRGIRIDTVGMGTQAGAVLQVEGFRVHTQLDESTLRQISQTTDGTYYAAADPSALQAVYDNVQARLVVRPEMIEITSIFAGAALLALLIGGMTSLLWLGRIP
jgi:Ca-activated chloride channel family protein